MHFKFGLKVTQELITFVNKFVSSFACNSTNTSRMLPNWITWDIIFRNYLLWFVPLFEKKSPLLHYFDVFFIKFNVTFGEANHESVG
jgi:hypothetical protein